MLPLDGDELGEDIKIIEHHVLIGFSTEPPKSQAPTFGKLILVSWLTKSLAWSFFPQES